MTKDTPTPRTPVCRYEGTSYECDIQPCYECRFRTLERDLSECRAALRELHDDIQGRIDDGDKFNPGTLHALSAARAILPPDATTGEGEGK